MAERKETKVRSPITTAKKWAYLAAVLGGIASMSGAAKGIIKNGGNPLVGFALGLTIGLSAAAILGFITFLVVWLIMVMKKS